MMKFYGNQPLVKKGSECTVDMDKGVRDRQNGGKKGLIFHVAGIKWNSDTEVEVDGGYYEGGLSSSGNTYTVKKDAGKWKVIRNKMNWIS